MIDILVTIWRNWQFIRKVRKWNRNRAAMREDK